MVSGEARGVGASLARLGLGAVSPVYAALMRGRNWAYDRGRGVRRLPRPVVSVGNLTTGGTGKTPVVRWLCERLRDAGRRPAVLMRGYKAEPGERGDEQAMLEGLLNRGGVPPVIVHAEGDRVAGGEAVLAAHPATDVFVLDDGFQHRRLARDFDLVLIDAVQPFGFGRVLPRGLLREPLSGLTRAGAVLVTRADQGDAAAVTATVRRFNRAAPVYRCVHAHVGLRTADGDVRPLETLAGTSYYAVAGIGNPGGLARQLEALPGRVAGARWLGDHWRYSADGVRALGAAARAAGAQAVLTTEKDWVKIAPLAAGAGLPIVRLELAVRFAGDDEHRLFEDVSTALGASSRRP